MILAEVYLSQRRFDESFDLHRRALVNLRETKGDMYFHTNVVNVKLAEHYARLGHIKNARQVALSPCLLQEVRPQVRLHSLLFRY